VFEIKGFPAEMIGFVGLKTFDLILGLGVLEFI
jgi:hypothetical protein